MSDGGDNASVVPASAREAARDQAKELRAQHRRRDLRRRWLIRGGVVVAVLLAGAVVAAVLLFLRPPAGTGPLNMQNDGLRIALDGAAVQGPGVPASGSPIQFPVNPPGVLDIRLYVDYLCDDCAVFTEQNIESLTAWADAGSATVEFHPIALNTSKSAGSQFSLRAANAAGCVANYAPDDFVAFHLALLDAQPAEGSEGPDDAELIALARAVVQPPQPTPSPTPASTPPAAEATAAPEPPATGAAEPSPTPELNSMPAIARCIGELRFRSWVIAATDRAVTGPIRGTELPAVVGVPTVIVNGKPFAFDPESDAHEFRQFVLQVAGEEFIESTTPAPTPVPEG